jgi:sirohydrochlorin cobaltochelatase
MLDRLAKHRRIFVVFLAAAALSLVCGVAQAAEKVRKDKPGILLVAFGTTVPAARVAFDNIDRKVRVAFPDIEVRWAYTSRIIRRKLARGGEIIPSEIGALAAMADDGFTRVAVQSLHTIPGQEFHGLARTAKAFEGMPKGIERIVVARPLLATSKDLERAVDALAANFPKERKAGDAVVLMGHGTHHPANNFYPALQYFLWKKDPNALVGTVEGVPLLDDVLAELRKRNVTKAYLMPFMSVAGDHARNDLAGDEPDSWKSILTKAGIECIPVLKGTAEFDAVVDIWVDHLKAAVAAL